jgi:hypothetical protein
MSTVAMTCVINHVQVERSSRVVTNQLKIDSTPQSQNHIHFHFSIEIIDKQVVPLQNFFGLGIYLESKGFVNANFLRREVSRSLGRFSGMRTHVMAMSE